jgi:hypothetical protein
MKKTVILFGTNTFTRHLIDWQRQDCEFWAWNEVGSLRDDRPGYWAKRVDLLLQLHASPIWRNHFNLNHGRHQKLENGEMSNSHYDWLQRPHEFPIYMQEHYDDVPSSVKYPFDEIVKEFLPNVKRDMTGNVSQVVNFTSSTAYAIALALYQGKEQIEIAGIEMTSDTEYHRQRAGVFFWLGIAAGRGVNVVIHSPLLMNDKLYGYTGEVVIQKQEFEMSAAKLRELQKQAEVSAFEAKGRTQALLDALLKTTSQSDANRLLQEFLKSLNIAQDATFQYGMIAGKYEENSRYMEECNHLIAAAGGEKALASLMENVSVPTGD